MTPTTYGYKNPDTGDFSKGSTGWMSDINYNWLRIDGHSHTGTDSAVISYFKGGTATGSFNQLTLPSNTISSLTALSRVAGNIYFGSDSLVPYYDNGSILIQIGAATPVVPQITKYLASNGATSYLFTVTSANATVGATYTNNGQTFTVLSTISGSTSLFASGTGTPGASGNLLKSSGTGDSTIAFSIKAAVYIPPAGCLYLRVRMVGGGGGGGASTANSGSSGGDTTFGTTLLSAGGGSGGPLGNATGGSGGVSSLGTGPTGIAVSGGAGGGGQSTSTSGTNLSGGAGGSSAFGGAAAGPGTNAGTAAATNSGSGGSGGAQGSANCGAGGGAGGFIDAIITTVLTYYAYAVGAAGAKGAAGTVAGGDGAAGQIEVTAYFQ